MSSKEKLWLLFSICISMALWGYLYGFFTGLILITGILFHEYGHYLWMKREGMRSSITMIPPFGAMAMAKDFYPSYGAWSRVALAGPVFGLISAVVAYFFWLTYPNENTLSAVRILSMINLFNLTPLVAPLDGAHVIKSILFSKNRNLALKFYWLSIFFTVVILIKFPGFLFIGLFILWLTWREYQSMKILPVELAWTAPLLRQINEQEDEINKNENPGLRDMMSELIKLEIRGAGFRDKQHLEKHVAILESELNIPKITTAEASLSLATLAGLYVFLLLILLSVANQ